MWYFNVLRSGNMGHWHVLSSLPQCAPRCQPRHPPPCTWVCDLCRFTSDVYHCKRVASGGKIYKEDPGKRDCLVLLYWMHMGCSRVSCMQRCQGLKPLIGKKKGGDPQSSRKPSSRGTETDKQLSTLWEWRSVHTGSCIFLVTSCHVRMSIRCWQHSVISKQRFYDCQWKSLSKKTLSPLSS